MKRIILILFCVLALPVLASHIVGGEFELVHMSGNQYRLNLILYFDEVNGSQGAKDQQVTARIFRKRDNAVMMDVLMTLGPTTSVPYTQPECAVGALKTSKLIYSSVITLAPDKFNDSEGYYVAWERCCRNYNITNIFSENPNFAGQYAGQTFYLEFPAVKKNGNTFINSSPRLFPPLSDYGCINKPYYVDFAGIDDDGDSLVYTMVQPLNTKSSEALPPGGFPRPKPYPSVVYRPGFSLFSIVNGSPDMRITRDGFLTVTPKITGLFVFAVKCEEFRDGVKIGEVRRDFQLQVLDCPDAEPPLIMAKKLGDPAFTYKDNMTLTFSNTVADADRCIQVEVSDPDALKTADNKTEKIKLRAIPIGFKKDMSGILPTVSSVTLVNGSKHVFDICFSACPPNESGSYQVGIIAEDDACSLPLSDTIRVTLNIQPPTNRPPYFETTGTTEVLNEGDQRAYGIRAVDPDGDALAIGIIPEGFVPAEVGMSVNVGQYVPGLYEADLNWDTRCNVYNFTQKTNFDLRFIVQDQDKCAKAGGDTIDFHLSVILPGNADPVISTDLQPKEIVDGVYVVERKVFENLHFNVTGTDDVDNDLLGLVGSGVGFNMTDLGATFPPANARTSVTSQFNWNVLCGKLNLKVKSEYDFNFIVKDEANKCRFYKADTLTVRVKVLPPDNEKPRLTITNTNANLAFDNNFQEVMLGQQISLALVSADPNTSPQDQVSIEMIDASGNVEPNGYVFEPATGVGSAQTTFSWLPDCSIFKDNLYENNYSFTFRTFDNRCFNAKADTVTVDLRVRDVVNAQGEFVPPNFVSANGDSYNDYFAMIRTNDVGQLENILPLDNCVGRFVSITIYNRWGTEVYSSNNRDFQWRPVNQAPGVYFYTLVYTNKDYKGTVTVRD
ncbi:MAG TPA: gliding motility-associated C-terminal domain-containing protein [Chryseosolibacter sp.]